MGNIVEKIGAMVARLGTKLANNYGGSADNRYILLHAPGGTNNERLDPNAAMSIAEFGKVLGAENAIPSSAIEDCNAPTRRIHYISGSTSANRPVDYNGYLITEFSYYGGVGSVRYSCQWAYLYGSSYNDIYFRTHSGQVWNAWRKVAFL